MFTAIYARVSSKRQETKSQEADLLAVQAKIESEGGTCRFFREKISGLTAGCDRPVWSKLWGHVERGEVDKIVVWRLDRLGRLPGEMILLLDDLQARGVALQSVRDGFDPSTPAGKLLRNILASFAGYETEVRSERQRAGIEAKRQANGGKCPWGGRKPGSPNKSTLEKIIEVHRMRQDGKKIAEIARLLSLSRPTVYSLLAKGN